MVSSSLVGLQVSEEEVRALSQQELRAAQQGDSDLKPLLQWKEAGDDKPPWQTAAPYSEVTKAYWMHWESLELKDGVLYHLWETRAGDKQLIFPKQLRPSVLQQLHCSSTAGHLGVNKTLEKVWERFYWVPCSKDDEALCKNRDLCASRRDPARKILAPLSQYNVGAPISRQTQTKHRLLLQSKQDQKYILIAADYFNKWVEAYPLVNQEAVRVAEVLVQEFISRFGVPLILHSDQGQI